VNPIEDLALRLHLNEINSTDATGNRHTDMPVRPAVAAFAMAMELKLRRNDHKKHWRECSIEYLLKRLGDEVEELRMVIEANGSAGTVLGEAVDVANFAMMIADVTAQRG